MFYNKRFYFDIKSHKSEDVSFVPSKSNQRFISSKKPRVDIFSVCQLFFKTVNNIQAKNVGLCQLYIDYPFLFLKVLSKYILIQVHVSWLVRCVVYK